MHPISRRNAITAALAATAATVAARVAGQEPPPADPTKTPGTSARALGERSEYERLERPVSRSGSQTPLQDLHGTITPSDLHYEVHHAGIPHIAPDTYSLLVHGLVDRPMVFTLDELKSFPSITYTRFLECSGNYPRNAPAESRAQDIAGLTSQSEWTGVPLGLLMREAGVSSRARWFLAEGMDAAVMTRSIPVEKALEDGIVAYAQNGEALRPANGYPVRLFLPGWEGNANVKWLRRLEFAERPFMTRQETSRYTDPLRDGTVRQFSFVIDARSIITAPSYPQTVRPGWIEVRGLAWSGRGRVARVELSFDDGATWQECDLQDPVLPRAHTRFRYMWKWNGAATTVLSRAIDETGYVQPTQAELLAERGPGPSPYHLNPIVGWRVNADGSVVYRTEEWA